MISLLGLKDFIYKHRIVRQSKLARDLKIEEALLALMLEQLRAMGYIKKMPPNPVVKCDVSCSDCGDTDETVYCWNQTL